MDQKNALHTAARRYCQARFSEWTRVYEDLQQEEKWRVEEMFQPGWTYSDEAYRTFPRYRIAKQTQVEIERLVPDSSASLSELRASLLDAATSAHAKLELELTNALARKALHEEAEDFKIYLKTLAPSDLASVESLPHRRVLSEKESKQIWMKLENTWHIDGRSWFPLNDVPIPPYVLAFHTDYFENIDGAELIRRQLEKRCVSRVFLVHEFGDPDYEIDLATFDPGYGDGGEQYSTSEQTDWMIYASHESSITLCGQWLTLIFRQIHPECIERTYRGPYSTPDLRGTWDTDQQQNASSCD
jgi:hypothetical protein